MIDVSPPSVCDILRNGPSGTPQRYSRGRGWTPTSPMPSSLKSVFFTLTAVVLLLLLPVLSSIVFNNGARPSSLENKILHNAGRDSLSQELFYFIENLKKNWPKQPEWTKLTDIPINSYKSIVCAKILQIVKWLTGKIYHEWGDGLELYWSRGEKKGEKNGSKK